MRTAVLASVLLAGCLDYDALRDADAGDDSALQLDLSVRADTASGADGATQGDADVATPPCGVATEIGHSPTTSNACCPPESPEYTDGGVLTNGTCLDAVGTLCLAVALSTAAPDPYCHTCGGVNDICCPPAGASAGVDTQAWNSCALGLRCMRSLGPLPQCIAATGCGTQGQGCCSAYPPGTGSGGELWCLPGLACTAPGSPSGTCQTKCGALTCAAGDQCLENNPGELLCAAQAACGAPGEPCCWVDTTFGWGCAPGATTCQGDTSSPNGTRCKL